MAERPYWSGQIRISLVTFAITLKSALKRTSHIPLHELDRKTGERIHHKNVTENGHEVNADDIIKGYQTEDKDYVLLEKDEISELKLPSSDTLELSVFTPLHSIPFYRFERPYFILPGAKDAKEIYAVIHEALLASETAGIGQITMRGREELCAVLPVEKGLMLQTLRYNVEIEDGDDFFPSTKPKLKSDYVTLANQLIHKNTHEPQFDKFQDHYHEALLELIKAKKAHRKPKPAKATKATAKVVNFADALRKSLGATTIRSTSKRKKAG